MRNDAPLCFNQTSTSELIFFIFTMNFFPFLLIGFYFLSIVEKYFGGKIIYENELDHNGVKELVFGDGFAQHLWSSWNQENEYMCFTNSKICLTLSVRRLYSVRYVILTFFLNIQKWKTCIQS